MTYTFDFRPGGAWELRWVRSNGESRKLPFERSRFFAELALVTVN